MNKTEAEYAKQLDERKAAGEVYTWLFEPLSLKLTAPDMGRAVYCTPDFLVVMEDGTTYFDDTKTAFRDLASDVRLKAAAEKFPFWIFRLIIKKPKKDGGGWEIKVL